MSTQTDYTPDEWQVLVHAPAQASMLVVNADKSGGFMGQFGIAQELRDAREVVEQAAADTAAPQLVTSTAKALIDEKSWKPLFENASPQTVSDSLQRTCTILSAKTTPDEAEAYKQYVLNVARKTASAVQEQKGEHYTSDKEAVAIDQIASLLQTHD